MTEEYIIINCRHCTTQNRLLKGKAVKNIKGAVCGECKDNLFLTDQEPFLDLSSESYEHPLDRSALDTLKKVPGTGTVLKTILKMTVEQYYKVLFIQNYIKVTPTHLTYINDLVTHATKILDIKKLPEVFVYQDPRPNAFTSGVDLPYIGISTSLIDLLSEEELLGVIAHELGHIQCGHVLYKTAARLIAQLTASIMGNLLGIGNLAIIAIMQALLYWDRCSELSADRAELLVTKSFETSVKTTMKLTSGSQKLLKLLNIDEFLKQADEAKKLKEENIFNKLYITIQSSNTTHPFPVWRTGHLQEWVYDGKFLDILQGKYIRKSTEKISDKDFKEEDYKKGENDNSILESFKKFVGL